MNHLQTNPYPTTDTRKRRLYRLAQMLRDLWEEGSNLDTRLFKNPYIHDSYATLGRTSANANYREHLVPCVYLRDQCIERFKHGWTVEQVTELLDKYLWIALIEKPTQVALVNKHHKTTMPDGWNFESGDVCTRLTVAGLAIQTWNHPQETTRAITAHQ